MNNEEVMKLLTDMGLHAGGMKNWIPDNAWVEVVNKVIAMEREACVEWLRDNYQDYKNIADICEAIRARGEK